MPARINFDYRDRVIEPEEGSRFSRVVPRVLVGQRGRLRGWERGWWWSAGWSGGDEVGSSIGWAVVE